MKRARWAGAGLLALLLMGCDGDASAPPTRPQADAPEPGRGLRTGEILGVREPTTLFLEEAMFTDYVEVARAGGDTSRLMGLENAARFDFLGRGSVVRVLRPVPGGARVVVDRWVKAPFPPDAPGPRVERTADAGRIGWIDEPSAAAMSR